MAPSAPDLYTTLLDVSLAGVIVLRPLYQPGTTCISDFAYEQLNPTAQLLLGQPARPTATFRQLYPGSIETGVFAFLCDCYGQDATQHYGVEYRRDGLNAYYQMAVRRCGEVLVMSFNDTPNAEQGAASVALQRSLQQTRTALAANVALQQTQQALEARVAQHKQVLQAAQDEADSQWQLLQTLFQHAPGPVCVLEGPELVYRLVNPAYQRLLPGRSLLGQPLLEAVPELAGSPVVGYMQQVYATGQPLTVHDERVQLAASPEAAPQDLYFSIAYQPLRNRHQQTSGLLVSATDVTALVQGRQHAQELNEQLRRTNQQLQRTNSDLDNFIYTASHDLKAPIANIEGLLLALQQELPPDLLTDERILRRLLAMMHTSVARFQQTIAQLSDVALLNSPEGPQLEAVDLAALIEAVRLDLIPALETAGAELQVDVSACPTVQFAPRHLRSIVYNLLSNAIKYRSPQRAPVVAIRSSCTPHAVSLQVRDNGLGLSAVQQSKLFHLFRRLHHHVDGSGVGLYALKKIVDNAGGNIGVSSEPEVGSTFTVTLPRAHEGQGSGQS